MRLIFEKGAPGRRGVVPPECDVPEEVPIPEEYLRGERAALPEVSELDVVRHFGELARRNFGLDSGFYPLGSCTMKYNPKVCEEVAGYEGFRDLHPLLPQLRLGGTLTQGALEVLHHLSELLCEITGLAAFTLQPLAGAHGELTGMMIIARYHQAQGNPKTKVLVPDSAHGTNPASAAIAGYQVVTVPSDREGLMDVDAFKRALGLDVAAVMLTCPNTLGLFNPRIREVADLAHGVGALMYYDGANLNAILGKCRPGDLGFDVVHLNLHKTFATPHGGGGPGAGPVGVCEELVEYLPVSVVTKRPDGTYTLRYDRPQSIGYIAPFYGNFAVLLRAYAYVLMLGREGLERVSEHAVLAANYLRARLRGHYHIPYDRVCMHEFVASARFPEVDGQTVRAIDIAKGLIDRGLHPPTVYFPLTVAEALMIEPTETESKETLDAFVQAMVELAQLARTDPAAFQAMPHSTPVSRPDETLANRKPDLASLGP
ncbi:MAG: aminomethyl-transferring glycine dehydrogenase subunit GcvPB [Planctomycetes bacterium]|nr:aminomethyl-transferring glycine dehydrogenase subunit GcvPB [Planctomycetota bacterium]